MAGLKCILDEDKQKSSITYAKKILKIYLILAINTLFSWILTKLMVKPFKKIIPDLPNKRSLHKVVKPRGGGLAFIISNITLSSIFSQINFIFLLPLSLTGLLDDFFNISRWLRIFMQLSTSFFILFNSNYYDVIRDNDNFILEFLLIFLLFLLVQELSISVILWMVLMGFYQVLL